MSVRLLGIVIFAALTTAFSACPVYAYIPPSIFIVKNIAAKHTALKNGLRIRAEVIALDPTKPGVLRFKSILSFNPKTSTLRAWALDTTDKTLFVIDKKLGDLSLAGALALDPRAPELVRRLVEKNVPLLLEPAAASETIPTAEISSLKRWKTYFAWVIGKDSPALSALWIEKDTFLPLRMIFSNTAEVAYSEFNIEGYKYQHGFAFPKTTTLILRNGNPLLKEEVSDLFEGSVASDFKDPLPTPGWTPLGMAASQPLKDLVDIYFKVLR